MSGDRRITKQTPGNAVTYSTQLARDGEAYEASPNKPKPKFSKKGDLPLIQNLAAKFETASPQTGTIKRSTRNNRSKVTTEKKSPANNLQTPVKTAPTPSGVRTKFKGQLTIEDSLNADKSSTKNPAGNKQQPSKPSKRMIC